MIKLRAVILTASSLVGWANIKVTEPSAHSIERSQVYKAPFDKVWTSSVDWFADHNVTVEKIEKESGLITAKYALKVSDKDLDCGVFDVNGTLGQAEIRRTGSLNVTVRSVNEKETKVSANFFGEYALNARDAWDGHLITKSGQCVSTGLLEKSILSYINK